MVTSTIGCSENVLPSGKKVSKVKVYKWKPLDEPGQFVMLDKALLNVDHQYQRDNVSVPRVLEISSNFSWQAFGVILVALREDQTLWVFDGQHRKLAADKRDDVTKLPCMVFRSSGIESEATAFLAGNTARGPVMTIDKYKAFLACGNKTALEIRDLVATTGHKVASNGQHTVKCIAFLMKAYKQSPEILKAIWPTLAAIAGNEVVREEIAKGFYATERMLRATSQGSILDKRNQETIKRNTMKNFEDKIKAAKACYGGGERSCMIGIVNALNFHRQNKISYNIGQDESE